ncbi:TRAP transporter permease [Roseitranquillus sediminis]|uniref:TRAP transporter permease n=1 Tax=Roseitranquillus sediminis TaxID=2809051 RepID=UPI001D0C612E|nr:TRAP transporter fused permease subunit [Roseitranquillus sediminis]MBM9594457.1 TRAP transporter fused permease subunit [Roseitranquillus sediminis]
MSDEVATPRDEQPQRGWASLLNRVMAGLIVVLAACWVLAVPSYLGLAFYREQLLALILGLAVAVVFLGTSWRGERRGDPPLIDFAFAAIFLTVMVCVAFRYQAFLVATASRPPLMILLSLVVVLGVLEALRRRTGWMLFLIVVGFVLYGLLAHLVPAPLTGRRLSLDFLLVYLAFDPSAALGMPLSVASTIVVIFILFGEVLFCTGGGQFFTDLAMAMVGRLKGGAAKIAVLSSAFFGSISGSAVSNVATTGLVTIPLMRRAGYRATDAGAIEAVASTGGQFMPPIMGAAAFLMAEFLNIDYRQIVLAALIPALLYYIAIFVQVHLMAVRDDVEVVAADLPRLGPVLRDGWHFFLPFVLLLVFLFQFNMSAERAALYAAATMLAIGLVRPYRGQKAKLPDAVLSFSRAGLNTVELITIVAAAGLVIGVLNSTGGGFAVTLALVQFGGGNLVALLAIGGLTCIVLGMGMPTAGVYVLLATLVAPAIVETGVEPIAAHMFVLYFGMMSMITPPIALACFAAATLTGASPMKTGFAAVRLGWVAYIVPILFVFSPTLLLVGDPGPILISIVTATFGVFLITAGVVGFYRIRLGALLRAAFAVAGLATLFPADITPFGSLVDLCGVLAGGCLLAACHHWQRSTAAGTT